MKTEIVAALRGGIAVGVTGFAGGVVVALISRWLRHAGDTECEFPVFKILAIVETNPDERGRKLLDLVGSIDDVTHAGCVLTVEFNNMKDLDVALGKFRVVFKRAGNDVIVTAPYKLTERSPLNDQVNIEGFGAIALRSRDPVSFTMKGYLHNLGYSDALDQLRAGYDEVIFRATREGSKSFERTIRDSPTPSGGPPGS